MIKEVVGRGGLCGGCGFVKGVKRDNHVNLDIIKWGNIVPGGKLNNVGALIVEPEASSYHPAVSI